jgi:hypothetical protein
MYGKLFECTHTGSMVGAGFAVHAVWAYVVAHKRHGSVELNPRILAAVLGGPEEDVRRAIDYLCAEDPDSRQKKENGKRLLQVSSFLYEVVNDGVYKKLASEIDRREQNKEAQRKHRSQVVEYQHPSACVSAGHQVSASVSPSYTDPNPKAGEKKTGATASPPPLLESLLEELTPIYEWIDMDAEKARIKAWMLANPGKRKLTRRFVTNWLNRIDRPMAFSEPSRVSAEPRRRKVWEA